MTSAEVWIAHWRRTVRRLSRRQHAAKGSASGEDHQKMGGESMRAPRKKPRRQGRLARIRSLTMKERLLLINEARDSGREHPPSMWTKRYRKLRKRTLGKELS